MPSTSPISIAPRRERCRAHARTGDRLATLVEALEESDLEVARLWLLATESSAGEEVEFGPGGTVDRAVHAAATGQRLVGGVDDGVDVERDIASWQAVLHVVLPLSKTGIIIGSIFVVALVMGDFITVGVMGGQQIASVGKTIQVQAGVLQFPAAAANAVVLLAVVLMMIWALMRLVDLRKEL